MTRRSLLQSTALGGLVLACPTVGIQAALAQAGSWTGNYIGIEGGYAWGRNNATNCSFTSGIGSPCQSVSVVNDTYKEGQALAFPGQASAGGLFGVEIGKNWQYQNWVVGLAADWSLLDVHSTYQFPSADVSKSGVQSFDRISTRYDWLGTARGRVGYAVGQSLFYGTGGFAVGGLKDEYDHDFSGSGFPQTFAKNDTLAGWTVGGGWEFMFHQNWTFKVEYLHVDLGKSNLDISAAGTYFTSGVGNPPGSSVLYFENRFDLVRAGIDFKW